MKNKKLLKALAALTLSSAAAAGCISLIGCSHKHEYSDTYSYDETYHWYGATCEHTDEIDGKAEHTFGADDKCTYCGYEKPAPHVHTYSTEWTKTETEHWYAATCEHKDEKKDRAAHNFDDDGVCSVCQYEKNEQGDGGDEEETEYTVAFDNGDKGTKPADQKVKKDGKVTDPGTLTETGWVFKGWYKDADHTTEFDFDTETITDNTTIYAWWVEDTEEPGPGPEDPVYEWVNTQCDFTDSAIKNYKNGDNKIPSPITVGRFTIGTGTYVEGEGSGLKITYGNINTQQKNPAVSFSLNGEDNKNKISFTVKGASGGKACTVYLYRKDTAGDVLVQQWSPQSDSVNVAIGFETADPTALPAGDYYLAGNEGDGSARLGALIISEYIEKSEPVSITVDASKSKLEYLVSEAFDPTGVIVTLEYANGKTEVVTGATIKLAEDAADINTAGSKTVNVSYTYPKDGTKVFNDTYSVTYVALANENALSLYTHTYSGKKTDLLQHVYKVGDTLSTTGLSVYAKSTNGHEFLLPANKYVVALQAGQDMSTAGQKTVEVTYTGTSAKSSYTIEVLDLSEVNIAQASVTVNGEGTVGVDGNVITVKTINDAIQIYKLLGSAVATVKPINVAPGRYFEKVEIDIPNVVLKGTGTYASDTLIEFNALSGLVAPGSVGEYSTDGSATVSIRAGASGFKAENITFQNYYNTHALYEQSRKIVGNTQAVACLVQADQVYFKNCRFSGYHDTLYDQIGRHVYENCYIEGRTDYIFGYNSTAFFAGCTIKTIGAGVTEKNGGYVACNKGNTKKGENVINYGFIFYSCTFTHDENVRPGSVSLGRAWDDDMKLAFINCEMSAAYSQEYYGEKTSSSDDDLNDRYTSMNGKPVPANIFEYGNTGAGALSQAILDTAVSGVIDKLCTILTAEQVSNFLDVTKIFSNTNGTQVYDTANPTGHWAVQLPDILGSVKASAIKALTDYRADDIAELESETAKAAIAQLKAYTFESETEVSAVNAKLAELQGQIDTAINNAKTPAQLQAEAKAELDEYIAEATKNYDATTDAELFTSINAAKETAGLDGIQNYEQYTKTLTDAKANIDNIIKEYAKAHTVENGSDEYNAYKAQFGDNVTVSSTFETEGKLNNFSGYGTAGIYQDTNADNKDFSGNYVNVTADKRAELVDNTIKATHLVVDFGTVKEVVEGYVEVTFKGQGTGWTPVQFVNNKGSEVLGFRIDSSVNKGNFSYRINGQVTAGDTAIASADNVVYKIHFKFNLVSGKVAIEIGADKFVTEAMAIDIKDLAGVKFVSSDGNPTKTMYVDNLIVSTYDLELEAYRTSVKGVLDAEKEKYATLCSVNVAEVNSAYETASATIGEATTKEAIKAAYDTAVTEFGKVETDAQHALRTAKETAIAELDTLAESYTTPGEDGNLTKFEAVYKPAKADINNADTPERVAEILAAAKSEISKILTDTDLTQTRYLVTWMDGDTEVDSYEVVENDALTEPTKPEAADSVFVGWYTNPELTAAYDFENTETNKVTGAITLYAKWNGVVDVVGDVTAKFDASTVESAEKLDGIYDGIIDILVYAKQGEEGLNKFNDNKCAYVKGGTSEGNKRRFKIDLTNITGSVTITVMASSNGNSARTMFFAEENTSDVNKAITVNGEAAKYSISGTTPTACTVTVNGGKSYYFCVASSNNAVYSITATYKGVKGQNELTAINGAVTLKEDGTADLSGVTFSVKDGEAVTAASLGDKVKAVVSEDNTYVTVSYGKLSKRFDIAA